MASNSWRAPELSSDSSLAIQLYRDGIADLVAGAGRAIALLDAARRADPRFALAHVAYSVVAGLPIELPDGAPTTRGERQHVETVRVWRCGDPRRARDLRREHLLEYAGDLFVVILPLVLAGTG
jgi:hypothetical protein